MLMMFSLILLGAAIAALLMAIAIFVSKKTQTYREKMTPYECGFAPVKNARSPFSLAFFLTTIIFLIFDVEVALILPLGLITQIGSWTTTLIFAVLFTFILLAGLLHEWNQGALSWAK